MTMDERIAALAEAEKWEGFVERSRLLKQEALPIIAELRAELATWHDIHGTENASEVADALNRVRLQRDEARAERDRLAERCERMRETLEWYGEQSRLCRLIHSEGDSGRNALSEDGGKRARAALAEKGT